jgi:hypothetical protein
MLAKSPVEEKANTQSTNNGSRKKCNIPGTIVFNFQLHIFPVLLPAFY